MKLIRPKDPKRGRSTAGIPLGLLWITQAAWPQVPATAPNWDTPKPSVSVPAPPPLPGPSGPAMSAPRSPLGAPSATGVRNSPLAPTSTTPVKSGIQWGAAPDAQAPPPGITNPVSNTGTLSAGMVSAAAAKRMRSAGLDPASPNYRTELNSRLARISTLARATPAHAAITSAARSSQYSSVTRASYTSARSTAGTGHIQIPASYVYEVYGCGDPTGISCGYGMDGVTQWPVQVQAYFTIADKNAQTDRNAIAHLSVPDCGIEVDLPAIWTNESANATGALLVGDSSAPFTPPGNGFVFFGDGGFLPVGTQAHRVNFSITDRDYLVTFSSFITSSNAYTEQHSISIGSTAPIATLGNDLGLTDANFNLAAPGVDRVNLGDAVMTGTDAVALSVPLSPGYGATATIVASHSILDSATDSSADNGYRGAKVVTQPAAGRAEAVVQWYIQPGDSLQYQVQWTFTGPDGVRPVTTLPSRGACDN